MDLEEKNRLFLILKDVFLYACNEGYSLKSFIHAFMNSDISENLFKNSSTHYFHPYNIYLDVVNSYKVTKDNSSYPYNVISYFSFIYSSLYYQTFEHPKKIYSYLPFDYLLSNFDMFHLIDEERVIYYVKHDYNRRNNLMRKSRSSHNYDISNESDRNKLFISYQIFKNLFYYPIYDEVELGYDNMPYIYNENVYFKAITVNSKKDIFDATLLSNENYKFYNQEKYLACILTDDNLELDSDDIDTVIKNNNRNYPFRFVIIYYRRKALFINIDTCDEYYFVNTKNQTERIIKNFNDIFS